MNYMFMFIVMHGRSHIAIDPRGSGGGGGHAHKKKERKQKTIRRIYSYRYKTQKSNGFHLSGGVSEEKKKSNDEGHETKQQRKKYIYIRAEECAQKKKKKNTTQGHETKQQRKKVFIRAEACAQKKIKGKKQKDTLRICIHMTRQNTNEKKGLR